MRADLRRRLNVFAYQPRYTDSREFVWHFLLIRQPLHVQPPKDVEKGIDFLAPHVKS